MSYRVQFAVYYKLAAEAIVEDFDSAAKLSNDWVRVRTSKGKTAGASIIRRADFDRTWDVKVGEEIFYDSMD